MPQAVDSVAVPDITLNRSTGDFSPIPDEAIRTLMRLRNEAADEIDRLLAFLDETETDPDLEPSLGYYDAGNPPDGELDAGDEGEETALELYGKGFKASGGDDAEDDDPDHGIDDLCHDGELDKGEGDTADDEPSLGWTTTQSERQPSHMTGNGLDAEGAELDPNDSLPRYQRKGGTDAIPNVGIRTRVTGRPTIQRLDCKPAGPARRFYRASDRSIAEAHGDTYAQCLVNQGYVEIPNAVGQAALVFSPQGEPLAAVRLT